MARSDSIKNKTDEEIVDFLSINPGHSYEIAAQAEMMRRLRNSIGKLDKNTQKYSKILIWLTTIMTLAVLVQIYLLLK